MRALVVLVVLVAGCKIDNGISGGHEPTLGGEETGYFSHPEGGVETADTSVPATCDDQSFAGYYLDPRECEVGTSIGTSTNPSWELVEKWSDMTLGSNVLSTVAIGELTDDNGDGDVDEEDVPDVVATAYANTVKAYDGESGSELWSVNTGLQAEQTTPAIGDLDGDKMPDVFVFSLYGSAALHGDDGSKIWDGPAPGGTKAYCGAVSIADVDEDGDPEAIFGRMIIDGQDGSKKAEGGYGYGSSLSGEAPVSVVADIDRDGTQEVIVGNAAYEPDGSALWSTSSGSGNDGFPAVANFDGDADAEVVATHRSGQVELLDTDGSQIWDTTIKDGGSYCGPPAIADFDGDGEPEIAVPTSKGVTVLDTDGTQLWSYANGAGTGMWDGVSAYDLDGDGKWEVLDNGVAGLAVLDGETGDVVASYAENEGYVCGQAPAIADLDGDGSVEIAYVVYGGSGGGGVRVVEDSLDAFVPGLGQWNEHGFSITNIDADGTVPTKPEPNWDTYNNFRAGPGLSTLSPSVNVTGEIVDVCSDECDSGTVYVWYSLGNDSELEITDPVTIEFWGRTETGDQLLATVDWTEPIPPSWEDDSQVLELTGFPVPLLGLYLKIDSAAVLDECDETDNDASWDQAICFL